YPVDKAEDKKDDGRRKNKTVNGNDHRRIPGKKQAFQSKGTNDQHSRCQDIKPPPAPVEQIRIDQVGMNIEQGDIDETGKSDKRDRYAVHAIAILCRSKIIRPYKQGSPD